MELINFLNKYAAFSEQDLAYILDYFEEYEFSKNQLILQEGEICRYFYFLEKGLIRFFVNVNGEEITKFFTVAPYFFTSKDSFRNKTRSVESIQALENCKVYSLNLENANKLLEIKPWAEFTRKFVNEVQSHTEDLLMQIKTQTAEERYYDLSKKYPEIIEKIQLNYLASFLGIKPQSLSRIRKKLDN